MVAWLRALCLALMVGLFAGGEAQAKWLRADTQRFVIYSDGDERSLREYAAMLEDFDIVLRHYHSVDQRIAPPRKLNIYLVRDFAELQRAVSTTNKNLGGFYIAGEDDIFAVAIRDRGGSATTRGDRSDILFHEYTHHFVAQFATFPYPGWMNEGLAEYFATAEIEEKRVDVGLFNEGRAYSLSVEWIPLEHLLARRTHEIADDLKHLYYAQAWLLTHYMVSDPARREQLEAYKAAISAGQDPVKAMETATGMDLKTLTQKLKEYTRKGLPSIRHARTKLADLPITITTLSPAADDLLLENQRLMNGLQEDARAPMLNTIRARAAKYPDDRLAKIVLARAEIFYGDRNAGEAILKKHLAANPNDAEALRLMARSRLLAAEAAEDADQTARIMAEARPYLVKANAIEVDNYQTYYYFAQSRMFDPGYPSDNTLELLLLAHRVAPQVDSITFHAAQALVLRKEFDRAKPMLTLLANDPHGGGASAAAKTLLNQIAAYTSADKPN